MCTSDEGGQVRKRQVCQDVMMGKCVEEVTSGMSSWETHEGPNEQEDTEETCRILSSH